MSTQPPLEDLLLAACERGITHLTLWPVLSTDGKLTYWTARGTPSTMHKYVEVRDLDPVVALRGLLLGMPKAPKRAGGVSSKPLTREPEITATVMAPVERPGWTDPQPQPEGLDTWLPKT